MLPEKTERIVRYAVARVVRDSREQLGMSQQNLADMVGMNRQYLSDLENCKANITLNKLTRIAYGLDVPMTRFFEIFGNTPLRLIDLQEIGYTAMELPPADDSGDGQGPSQGDEPNRKRKR